MKIKNGITEILFKSNFRIEEKSLLWGDSVVKRGRGAWRIKEWWQNVVPNLFKNPFDTKRKV